MRASAASHLPSTTFCWLPPDSVPTRCRGEGVLMLSRAISSSASARRRWKLTSSDRDSRSSTGKVEVLGDGPPEHEAAFAPLFRHEPEAGLDGRARRGQANGISVAG